MLTPTPHTVIHNVLAQDAVTFVLFSFDEEGAGTGRLPRSLVEEMSGSTTSWPRTCGRTCRPLAPDPFQFCPRRPQVSVAPGGFVNPTVDRVVAMAGTKRVAQTRPIGGSVLLLAPFGSDVIAYRDHQVVASWRIRNLPASPSA